MAENKINVTVSANTRKNITVTSSQVSTEISASADTGRFWAQTAKNWAVSDVIVDNTDYSSKYYANKAKESASNAQGSESAIRDVYNGFLGETTEAIENVQGARDEAIANIETSRVEAIDSINSTKTTILNDIEFVADGEKQEINELADVIKDNANTVNIAIEAGVERLNSIDALKKSQITNCLLEVPQNIKLELNEGTLTLKAGSKVIVPNGFEADGVTKKFDYLIMDRDTSFTYVSEKGATTFMFYDPTGGYYDDPSVEEFIGTTDCFSGDVAPAPPASIAVWYDTVNNIMKSTQDKGVTWEVHNSSLPICFARIDGTGIYSVDQVFNGMGYIGSTVWVDKGVKGLIPDGRNEDGSLKNIEVTTNSVSTIQVGEKSREVTAFLFNTGEITKWGSDNGHIRQYKSRPATPEKTYVKAYIEDENVWWYGDNTTTWVEKQYLVPLFKVYTNANAQILSADLKFPFRAIDYSDSSTISGWGMPSNKYIDLTLGASGTQYTAPASGWLTVDITATALRFNTSKKMFGGSASDKGSINTRWSIELCKGDTFWVHYSAVSTVGTFAFIYAQGEV